MSDKSDIENMIGTLSPKTQRGLEIITPDDVPNKLLYHISTNTKIKEFVPVIGFRQAKQEDRTVPRVCVAPHLFGCMIGYSAFLHDILNQPNGVDGKKSDYKGGYRIYGFEFKHALKPNKSLVYDVNVSDERWLVAYNENTAKYVPVPVGYMFATFLSTHPRVGQREPEHIVTLCLEVTHEDGLQLSTKQKLDKGYWEIVGPVPEQMENARQDKLFKITAISKEEYTERKVTSAAFLNYQVKTPAFINW